MEYKNLVLLTAFSTMASDGEIANEELFFIKKYAEENEMFSDVNLDEELKRMVDEINISGLQFLKDYLITLRNEQLSKEQELELLRVSIRMIEADKKVEYAEVKFFKLIRRNLHVLNDNEIVNQLRIERSWIARDLTESYTNEFESYFNSVGLPNFEIRNL